MACSVDAYRAAIGLFFGTLQKILQRKALIAANRIRGLRVRGVSTLISLATLLCLLLIAGVESNSGPRQQKSNDTSLQKDNSCDDSDNFRRLHEMLANVSTTMERMETAQNSFSAAQETLSSQVSDIKTNLDIKLDEIERKQEEHEQRINDLSEECDKLQEENESLRSKLDYLENQSRRNNLLFHGIPEKKNETWEDCEKTLYDIIYGEMGVRTNILIERAHRVGTAVIAKFLSYKDKVCVLSRAKYLRGTDIYVREDVSEMVREKQKGLMPLMKDLRERNERAKIQYDKLITSVGNFTYDLSKKRVIKLERNKKQLDTRHEIQHTRREISTSDSDTNLRHGQHTDSPSSTSARAPNTVTEFDSQQDSRPTTEMEQGRQPRPSTPSTPSRPSTHVPETALYSEAAKTQRQRIPSPTPGPSSRRDSMSLPARPQTKTAGRRTSTGHPSSSADSVLNENSGKNFRNGRSNIKDGKRQGRLDHMLTASQNR